MNDFYSPHELVEVLIPQGVQLLLPEQTAIRRDVDLRKLGSGVVLHPGTRLQGSNTNIGAQSILGEAGPVLVDNSVIGPATLIGAQGPVTLRNTWVGERTTLGMGVAEDSVFLGREHDDAPPTTGVGFRVRKGSLYEEGASSAQHTDTKMTVLLPWTTLGSNLNFCDVLLAGGVGDQPGQFSEVGSGTTHFNFTIRGDKATASLLGNVAEGVFLRSERLFIGGNNSLLGPLQAEFGAFSAAGARISGSMSRGLNLGQPVPSGHVDYDPRSFPQLRRAVLTQLNFLGELNALFHWYAQIRPLLAADDFQRRLYQQAQTVVQRNLHERIQQLGVLTDLVRDSLSHSRSALPEAVEEYQQNWLTNWPRMKDHLQRYPELGSSPPPILLQECGSRQGSYTQRVQQFSDEAVTAGQNWLKSIAQELREGGPA